MSGREWSIWGWALMVSLLVHGGLFFKAGARLGAEQPSANPQRTITRVNLRPVAAPPPETAPERIEPETPEPEPEPKPQPVKPEPKPQPEPEPEPAPEPEPESPPPPKTPPETATAASEPTPAVAGQAVAEPALVEREKNAYLGRLIARIEAHKHYPRVARRRGIEGEVAVSFSILPEGGIGGLQTAGSYGILQSAAAEAVRSALPLPPPPESMALPLEIHFTMTFSLR